MTDHILKASPETVHWGYFDATLPPVLTIESGDRVTVETVAGGPEVMPPAGSGMAVLPELSRIHEAVKKRQPGHIVTGPIAVKGARTGQVLQVDIEAISLRQDWGYNFVRPLSGALPNDFDTYRLVHIPLDRQRMVGRLSWGAEVPLKPFFGVIGVAPPKGWGRITSIAPRRHGGNMDNKELTAGATLYLPIHVDGALLSVGDGHGAQGDGEVCVTAIETPLTGTFRVTLRPDMQLEWPMAETATHVITMAFDPDLDDCAATALRQMIALLGARRGLSREDAYMLCSLAADLRITQMVNQNNGVHVMLEKRYFAG